MNNDAYKLKYMKYKAKYLDMRGGAAQPVGEITLDKQTEILAHPTLGIRPKFPLAKLYKAAHITLRPKYIFRQSGACETSTFGDTRSSRKSFSGC